MSEIWKPVVGFEGLYEVSNFGRVASPNGILKGSINRDGYRRYHLSLGSQKAQKFGHVIVLEAFRGPCPPEYEGAHEDGNPDNNHLGNLNWKTKSANQLDRRRHNTDCRGEKNVHAKLTEIQVREIALRYPTHPAKNRGKALAAEYGVSQGTICQVANEKTWPHIVRKAA